MLKIKTISPDKGHDFETALKVTVGGEGFVSGTKLSFKAQTVNVAVRQEPITSAIELVAIISYRNELPWQQADVIVTNPDGETDSLKAGFTIEELRTKP